VCVCVCDGIHSSERERDADKYMLSQQDGRHVLYNLPQRSAMMCVNAKVGSSRYVHVCVCVCVYGDCCVYHIRALMNRCVCVCACVSW
jgi:hypothetical protein